MEYTLNFKPESEPSTNHILHNRRLGTSQQPAQSFGQLGTSVVSPEYVPLLAVPTDNVRFNNKSPTWVVSHTKLTVGSVSTDSGNMVKPRKRPLSDSSDAPPALQKQAKIESPTISENRALIDNDQENQLLSSNSIEKTDPESGKHLLALCNDKQYLRIAVNYSNNPTFSAMNTNHLYHPARLQFHFTLQPPLSMPSLIALTLKQGNKPRLIDANASLKTKINIMLSE